MEDAKSLNEILGDFNPSEASDKSALNGGTVTIWLSAADKARYDQLQIKSGRRFSKKAREALLALIEIAEARTA
jgi:hypothetical protein